MHPRNDFPSSSTYPPQNVAQPVQQTTQSENITNNTSTRDWTSGFGLDESDLRRASYLSSSAPNDNPIAIQQPLPKRNSPASIMTSIRGVPLYSDGTSADPVISRPRGTTELQSFRSTRAACGILLPAPRVDPTIHHNTSAHWSSSLNKSTVLVRPEQQLPADNTPQDPQPFDPAKCHWRALRDVALVRDAGMDVTWEDLGALLRFRYGTVDPQMAALERCHIQAMHDFGKGLPHKMYEEGAGVFIKKQMDEDLETMREGGVVVVNEDF